MSSKKKVNQILKKIKSLFRKKDFWKMKSLIEECLNIPAITVNQKQSLLIYAGFTYFHLKMYQDCERVYQEVINTPGSVETPIDVYLGLSELYETTETNRNGLIRTYHHLIDHFKTKKKKRKYLGFMKKLQLLLNDDDPEKLELLSELYNEETKNLDRKSRYGLQILQLLPPQETTRKLELINELLRLITVSDDNEESEEEETNTTTTTNEEEKVNQLKQIFGLQILRCRVTLKLEKYEIFEKKVKPIVSKEIKTRKSSALKRIQTKIGKLRKRKKVVPSELLQQLKKLKNSEEEEEELDEIIITVEERKEMEEKIFDEEYAKFIISSKKSMGWETEFEERVIKFSEKYSSSEFIKFIPPEDLCEISIRRKYKRFDHQRRRRRNDDDNNNDYSQLLNQILLDIKRVLTKWHKSLFFTKYMILLFDFFSNSSSSSSINSSYFYNLKFLRDVDNYVWVNEILKRDMIYLFPHDPLTTLIIAERLFFEKFINNTRKEDEDDDGSDEDDKNRKKMEELEKLRGIYEEGVKYYQRYLSSFLQLSQICYRLKLYKRVINILHEPLDNQQTDNSTKNFISTLKDRMDQESEFLDFSLLRGKCYELIGLSQYKTLKRKLSDSQSDFEMIENSLSFPCSQKFGSLVLFPRSSFVMGKMYLSKYLSCCGDNDNDDDEKIKGRDDYSHNLLIKSKSYFKRVYKFLVEQHQKEEEEEEDMSLLLRLILITDEDELVKLRFKTLLNLSVITLTEGKLSKCEEFLTLAKKINSKDASLQNLLGKLYFKKQDFEMSKTCFINSVKLSPSSNPSNYRFLGLLYYNPNSKKSSKSFGVLMIRALKCFRKAIHLNPMDEISGKLVIQLIMMKQQQNDNKNELLNDEKKRKTVDEVKNVLKNVVRKNDRCYWALEYLSNLYLSQRKYLKAQWYFQRCLQPSPDSRYGLWEGLGSAYFHQGKFLAGLKSFEKAVRIQPKLAIISSYYICYIRGVVFGDFEKGVILFRDFVEEMGKYSKTTDKNVADNVIQEKYEMLRPLITKSFSEMYFEEAKKFVRMKLMATAVKYLIKSLEILEHNYEPPEKSKKEEKFLSLLKLKGDVLLSFFHIHSSFINTTTKTSSEDRESENNNNNNNKTRTTNTKIGFLKQSVDTYSRLSKIIAMKMSDESGSFSKKEYCSSLFDLSLSHFFLFLTDASMTNHLESSFEHIRDAIRIQPRTPRFWNLLGSLYLRLPSQSSLTHPNNLKKAQHCFSKSIQLDPKDNYRSWNLLGFTYLKLKDVKKSAQIFLTSKNIKPEVNYTAFLGLGILNLKRKKWEDALELLDLSNQICVTRVSTSFSSYISLSCGSEVKNDETKLNSLEKKFKNEIRKKFGDYRDGMERMKEELSLGELNIFALGLEEAGRFEEAEKIYKSILSSKNVSKKLWTLVSGNLGRLCLLMKRYHDAKKVYTKNIECTPEFFNEVSVKKESNQLSLLLGRSLSLALADEPDSAFPSIKTLLASQRREDEGLITTVIKLLLHKKQNKRCLKYLQKEVKAHGEYEKLKRINILTRHFIFKKQDEEELKEGVVDADLRYKICFESRNYDECLRILFSKKRLNLYEIHELCDLCLLSISFRPKSFYPSEICDNILYQLKTLKNSSSSTSNYHYFVSMKERLILMSKLFLLLGGYSLNKKDVFFLPKHNEKEEDDENETKQFFFSYYQRSVHLARKVLLIDPLNHQARRIILISNHFIRKFESENESENESDDESDNHKRSYDIEISELEKYCDENPDDQFLFYLLLKEYIITKQFKKYEIRVNSSSNNNNVSSEEDFQLLDNWCESDEKSELFENIEEFLSNISSLGGEQGKYWEILVSKVFDFVYSSSSSSSSENEKYKNKKRKMKYKVLRICEKNLKSRLSFLLQSLSNNNNNNNVSSSWESFRIRVYLSFITLQLGQFENTKKYASEAIRKDPNNNLLKLLIVLSSNDTLEVIQLINSMKQKDDYKQSRIFLKDVVPTEEEELNLFILHQNGKLLTSFLSLREVIQNEKVLESHQFNYHCCLECLKQLETLKEQLNIGLIEMNFSTEEEEVEGEGEEDEEDEEREKRLKKEMKEQLKRFEMEEKKKRNEYEVKRKRILKKAENFITTSIMGDTENQLYKKVMDQIRMEMKKR